MGTEDNKEQRRDRRVATELRVSFSTDADATTGEFETTTTTGVSCSGLSFLSRRQIPIGAHVLMRFMLPGGGDEMSVTGQVVRIVSPDEGEGIEYGVRFDPPLTGDVMSAYVRSIDVTPLLDVMVKRGATHLYLACENHPLFRINRQLVPALNRTLSQPAVEALSLSPLNSARLRELRRRKQIEFVHFVPGVGRWRVNVAHHRGQVEAAFHSMSSHIRDLEELGLPMTARDLALAEFGLVIITGHRGSGKSATVAAMIDAINNTQSRVIATVEDSIEYIHTSAECVIQQSEVGIDVRTCEDAVRFALRQDPDVLVVHRLDTVEVADMVLHAAQAGRLVIAVVPGMSLYEAIELIEGLYPAQRRDAARALLSSSLQGIISHTLLPKLDRTGLVLAAELLLPNDGIRSSIRVGNLTQIRHMLSTVPGSQSLDVSLRNLTLRGVIDREIALKVAFDSERLNKMLAEH
jgi:twitching motility protein PilT